MDEIKNEGETPVEGENTTPDAPATPEKEGGATEATDEKSE